jgi:cold shock CspA family protein
LAGMVEDKTARRSVSLDAPLAYITDVQGGNGSEPDASEVRKATGRESIEQGTKVEFDLGSFRGRENAVNLRVLDDEVNDDEGNLQSEYIKSLD